MNSFLQDHLNLLQDTNIPWPELELRILLNKTSVIDKEIIFSNFELREIDLKAFYHAIKRRINNEPISKIFFFLSRNGLKYEYHDSNVNTRSWTPSSIKSVPVKSE